MPNTNTTPRRDVRPTVVTNKHGARFLLIAYTESGGEEVAELIDPSGSKVWLPVAAFRNHFTA